MITAMSMANSLKDPTSFTPRRSLGKSVQKGSALIRPRSHDGTAHFWFHQFIAQRFQRLLEKHTTHGATVNRIALKSFPDLLVLVPSIELRRAFDETVCAAWGRIHANNAQARTLATLRDALLPRLMSGQLGVPEATEVVEHALATTP